MAAGAGKVFRGNLGNMTKYWHRNDGKKIEIEKLSNSHLLNILGVLQRSKSEAKNFPAKNVLMKLAVKRKLLGVIGAD